MNSAHQPLLANLLGYSAGTLIFGIFLALLLKDRAGQRLRSSRLTLAATLAALAWNAGSLALLFVDSTSLLVLTTSALSLLPALLLDQLLDGRLRWIVRAGYALSAAAMGLHASEQWLSGEELHGRTLMATAVGFAVLTGISGVALHRKQPELRRALAAMGLALFALSLVHFHNEGAAHAWPWELAVHHSGIPLALFVLMQDYRFVLLDAFLRFLANILLAGLFTWGAAVAAHTIGWVNYERLPVNQVALMALGSCAVLVSFALARGMAQVLLTRIVFRRGDPEVLLEQLRKHPIEDEASYLDWAWTEIAKFLEAERNGESLGRRAGGRPYLSEDLAVLTRLETQLHERVEQYRRGEMRQLVSQAELRALQAQIHPHFLFNALNTLYGIIPKEAGGARRTVLNLADIFRYFLQTERRTIALEDEMRIVRSYLEIESLRLGSKLRIQLDVDPAALPVQIPVLSVQPLVENAVKHGVAPREHGGLVRVTASVADGQMCLRVADTGAGFGQDSTLEGAGVGLANVRRRLQLCYQGKAELVMERSGEETVVGFSAPLK
jgi:anti-sigma regulatory factor (Ser/Thr protein kinase)